MVSDRGSQRDLKQLRCPPKQPCCGEGHVAANSEWPLGAENSSRLTASKKAGILVFQLQRTEFCQHSASWEMDPKPQMRLQFQQTP